MWILHFLPDSLIYIAIITTLAVGGGLYVLGLLANFFPSTRPYREPIRVVSTLILIAGIYFYGGYSTEMQWRARVNEAQAKVKAAEEKSQQANVQIQTKIVTKIKTIHDTKVVTQEIIKEEAAKIDAECKVAPEAITILNAAARGEKPKLNLEAPKEEVK